MFGRIRRYYRDNKAKVWKTIAVIVFIFIAIRFLNYLARINREERQMFAVIFSKILKKKK